jgi:hypothetical protein
MLTTNFKNKLLRAICGKESFTNSIYAALSSTDPATAVTEPTATSYKRTAICQYGSNGKNLMGTPTDGAVENTETIYFPEATEAWGAVSYVALYTALTDGDLIGYAHIVNDSGADTTLTVAAQTVPLIRAGKFKLAFVEAAE